MRMMNGISNKILIVLAILIRYTSTVSTMENGTDDGMMFVSNDLQCLAQMPVGDLMKIRKAIRMMHAVSEYDAHRLPHLTAIDNQNQNQTDSLLRELPEADTRNAFQYFSRYPNSTNLPMAQRFMMTSPMHKNPPNKQLMHKTGYGSEWEEEKPSKIQKILHLSITALTFLAFAGYLLCMIVQAIKSKGTTYFHQTSLPIMSTGTETTNRVTGFRPNRFGRNKRAAERIMNAEPDPLDMFEVLLAISKGYVQLSNLSQPPI
ncbi:uncharacterized protein LOC116348801 [Contarinia nasturtii]|uniref:uncharacterized protein LOC116348801 n=1 Tax=Contarinia nasturtii TaxID=265458 RepID=UPI0012D3ACA1|nr:uncharacterized protein LOC116348801 [Contarinia nasturtii]